MIDWDDHIVKQITTPGSCSEVSNVNFHRVELYKKRLAGITFKSCDFRGAFIISMEIEDCSFVNCSLIAANFHECQLKRILFTDSRVRCLNFNQSRMTDFDFILCEMSGAHFVNSVLENGNICDIPSNLELTNTSLQNVSFKA